MVRWIVTMIIAVATIFATIDVVAADVIPISGDLDGDGIDIYGTFNSISATFTFNGKTVSYGVQTDLPIVGDWDNDGKDEIGVFRPNDGGISKLHIVTRDWSSLSGNVGSADYVISFAGLYSNNIPVVGNWDGLGGDDIGLFNPNTFYLYTLNPLNLGALLTSRYKDVPFGMNGDKPFSGDWDNDGIDDLGMFRPQYPNSNTNSFFLDKGLTGNQAELGPYEYGNTGDIPVIGDWDGDGVDNIGVYRPSPGEFFKDTYDPIYEGAIVTNGIENTPNWLLQNNIRQKITNGETLSIIYNSNGNRHFIFSDNDINKIPQGADITYTETITLSVTTTPVSGSIYVDGIYKETGSWSGSVNIGSHTISYGAVSGYTTPPQQTITFNIGGQTATLTGTYIPNQVSVGQSAPDLATKNHFIDAYNRNGGINFLGNPATEVHRAWGFLVQDFPGASGYGGGIIIYNPYKNYAYYIHSEIWERYYNLGGPKAITDKSFELGPPTSDIEPYVHSLPAENSKYGTPFRYQKFEGGVLELNQASGSVFEMHGGILQKWRDLGYASSNLGLPTTDEREAAVSTVSGLTGRYNVFEGGIIHWIRERNDIFVIGLNQPEGKKIADKYYAEGGSGGWLGFPVSDDHLNNFGYLQVNFEGGYITTEDGMNYVAYPKDITSGPTIKIEIPQTNFHTDERRIRLAGIANSDGPITRIDAKVQVGNGEPTFYRIDYDYKTNTWEANVGLQYGLNIIDVSVADGNFHGSRDTISVYYDIPDFSFAHITDVHIGDYTLPLSSIKKSRITKVLNQINNEIPKPDFILVSGDLVDYSNEDYFNQFNSIFTSVKAYIVAGNHDRRFLPIGLNDHLSNYLKNIDKSPNLHYIDNIYKFEEKGYQFIGLDSGSDYDYLFDDILMDDFSPEGTGLTDTQLSGLKEFDKTTPKIIFMHNPAIDDSDDKLPPMCFPSLEDFGQCKPALISNINYGGNDETIANNREEFIDYTNEYNVQLVLSGHTHENYIFNSHGTKVNVLSDERPLFIQTGSAVGNDYKEKYGGLTISNLPPLYGYRIINLKDGKAYPREFMPIELPLVPNTDLMPQFESTDRSKLTLELRCPANLNVYDSQGRHTGLNSSGGIETNIPDSFYIGRYNASNPDEAETIFLYNTTEEYRFEIIANLTEEQKNSPENESFNFTIDRQSEGIQTIESFQNITLNENTTATLQVNITTENSEMSLDYNGDTLKDEIKHPNSIETNYAPTAAIITPEISSIYNESEIVEFNGTGRDPEDGILTNYSLVWYSDIDGTIGSGERFSTGNLSAGSYKITLMVNDSMYQYGASSITITIADTAPPVTTLIPSGTPGNNGWYISDVNITLTATDTQTGSGVNITEYSFDNATWTTYLIPFNITSEGITTVYYRSTDNASNVESTRNQTIQIDKTSPSSIINPQSVAGFTYINLTWLNPPDPDFSHVMLYLNGTFIINIMAPQNYYDFAGLDPDTVYELGTHTVDIAGNINTSWVNATARTPLAVTSGSIIGQAKYSNNGTGIAGITANLTNSSHLIVSVTTNSSGFYNFTGIAAGNYSVILSNAGLFGNSTNVVVSEGPTSIVNMLMWLKGDLNNNGEPADASDLLLMKRASIGLILGDFKFDLNNNGEPADASDLLLMKRASIGAIQLI